MIIAKTPFRISLAGGSTDLESFLDLYGQGSVISFPCNLYTYITIFDDKLGLNSYDKKYIIAYSKREAINQVDKIKNDIARIILKKYNVAPINATFNSDIFSSNCGLASSSSYTLSFLNAILGPTNLVCVLCTKMEETGKQLYYNIFSRTTPPANRICMPRPNPLQLWHLTFHGWGTNREPGIHGKIHLKDDTEKLTFNFVNVGGRIACTVYGSNEKLIKDIKARPYYSGIRSFLLLFIMFFSIPLVSNIIFPILEPRGDSDEVTFFTEKWDSKKV